MNEFLTLTACLAIGAAVMYLLDPDRGRGRRAFVRDKLVSSLRKSARFVDQRSHDLENRVHGMVTERRLRRNKGCLDDNILAERVRAKMGHKIAHPHAIEVAALQGIITLAGRAPELEIVPALAAARQVRGVIRVKDRIIALPQESTLRRVLYPMDSRTGLW